MTGDDRHKGGVYEILRTVLPYLIGAEVQVEWLDVTTKPEARPALEYAHLLGHGYVGAKDWRSAHELFANALKDFGAHGATSIEAALKPTDVVVLHDTQTAMLAPRLASQVAHLVWHAHIGTSSRSDESAAYWELFSDALLATDCCVFYLDEFIPESLRHISVTMIPSIDPSLAKNQVMDVSRAREALVGYSGDARLLTELTGRLARLEAGALVATQVSRWDPLKDMTGVVKVFGEVAAALPNFHGLVVGTVAQSANELAELRRCVEVHSALPDALRQRIHVLTVAASGTAEHDAVIRSAQASADIVVQKSLKEGFGLTVTEAMLKGKAVVASAVGGIRAQITDGTDGLLVDDPSDTSRWRDALLTLSDSRLRTRLGAAASKRALEVAMVDRHLRDIARHVQSLQL